MLQEPPVITSPVPPRVTTTNRKSRTSIWDGAILRQAAVDAVKKLDPRHLLANPVMFVVEIGAAVTTYVFLDEVVRRRARSRSFSPAP